MNELKADGEFTAKWFKVRWGLRWFVLIMLVFYPILDGPVHQVLRAQSQVRAARQAELDLLIITEAIYQFWEDVGRFPGTQEGLTILSKGLKVSSKGKHLLPSPSGRRAYLPQNTSFHDPWERDYQYFFPGQHDQGLFDLFSMGQDGLEGTLDDINSWSENSPWKEHYKHLDVWNDLFRFFWNEVLVYLLVGLGISVYLIDQWINRRAARSCA